MLPVTPDPSATLAASGLPGDPSPEAALLTARLWSLPALAGYRRSWLVWGWLLSLAVHISLFVWLLQSPPTSRVSTTTIEVALVNAYSDTAPDQARLVAQQALQGGGTLDTPAISSSPLPRTRLQTANEQFLAALRKRQATLEYEQQELLLQLEATEAALEARRQTDRLIPQTSPGDDPLDLDSQLLSARIHALRKQIADYNERPRTHFTGPSAQEAVYAEYAENWRRQIEAIGTGNYPVHAGQRLYGQLQLTVYIQADGGLERIEIDRPADQAVLNLAARRIVQLAAPFAPLPEAIRQETDTLAITRTWHFTNEQLTIQ